MIPTPCKISCEIKNKKCIFENNNLYVNPWKQIALNCEHNSFIYFKMQLTRELFECIIHMPDTYMIQVVAKSICLTKDLQLLPHTSLLWHSEGILQLHIRHIWIQMHSNDVKLSNLRELRKWKFDLQYCRLCINSIKERSSLDGM